MGCPGGLGSPRTQPARGILAVTGGDYEVWHLFPQVKSVCVKRKCKPYIEVQEEGMKKEISKELHASYKGVEFTSVQLFQTAFR